MQAGGDLEVSATENRDRASGARLKGAGKISGFKAFVLHKSVGTYGLLMLQAVQVNQFYGDVDMKVIVDLCVVPIGVGVSLSSYVAACEDVLKAAGLKTELHSNGTGIEGEWDDVMAGVKACHEKVHKMGAPRVYTTMKVSTRTDRDQGLEEKVQSVLDKQG